MKTGQPGDPVYDQMTLDLEEYNVAAQNMYTAKYILLYERDKHPPRGRTWQAYNQLMKKAAQLMVQCQSQAQAARRARIEYIEWVDSLQPDYPG